MNGNDSLCSRDLELSVDVMYYVLKIYLQRAFDENVTAWFLLCSSCDGTILIHRQKVPIVLTSQASLKNQRIAIAVMILQ